MEKTEMMKRYESETGKQSAIVKFMAGGQALESKDFPKIGSYDYSTDYIAWLEAKAATYDRLMSGEYTLKDLSNIFQMYSAIDADGYARLFSDPPFIENKGWTSNFPEDEFLIPGIVKHVGDWKDSLTLPDGWEVTEENQDRPNVWVCPKCGCETPTRGSMKGKVACIECGHVIHEADE